MKAVPFGKLAAFITGVLVTFLLATVVGILHEDDPVDRMAEDFSKDSTIFSTGIGPVTVRIKRGQADVVEEIQLLRLPNGQFFTFVARGRYGTPEAMYAGGSISSGVNWVDLNMDGTFDERVIFKGTDSYLEASIGGSWVKVKGTPSGERVRTSAAEFEFDPYRGEWHTVISGAEGGSATETGAATGTGPVMTQDAKRDP